MTYAAIGNDKYIITVKVFRDCDGTAQNINQINLAVESNCGLTQSYSLPFIDSNEVSQICNSQLLQSACRGGTLPGIQEYIYSDTIYISSDCDYYTLSLTDSSRNAGNANLQNPSLQNMYVPATIYTASYPGNSSPCFTARPVPYFCAGSQVTYGLGLIEPDGDSLVFSLEDPLSGPFIQVPFQNGYSANDPLITANGFNINSQTGQLSFTPSNPGIFSIVILCKEYDRNTGQIKGSIRRDFEVIITNCSNQPVNALSGMIAVVHGDAVQLDCFTMNICEGGSFSFDATYTDPDTGDVLTATFSNPISGLSMTTSGPNPLIANISGVIPLMGGNNYLLNVQVSDGACPMEGTQFFSYLFNVIPNVELVSDRTVICENQMAQIVAKGGTEFSWYTMVNPGDSIPLTQGINIFEDPAHTDTATVLPLTTTTYIAVNNLSASCKNRDTITVYVVPDFNINISASSQFACLPQSLQVNANATAGSGSSQFSYQWYPASQFSNDTIASPIFSSGTTGTYQIMVEVESGDGCRKSDTALVNIASTPALDITAIIADTLVCNSASTQLGIVINSAISTSTNLNYTWISSSAGTSVSNNSALNPVLTATEPADVTVIVSDQTGTCSDISSVHVGVRGVFSLSEDSICQGSSAASNILTNSSGGTWLVNPATPAFDDAALTFNANQATEGSYIISYVNGAPCFDTVSKILMVTGLANITIASPSLTHSDICKNEPSMILMASPSGGVWSGSAAISGSVFQTSMAQEGDHFVNYTIIDADGCFSRANDTIRVNPVPVADFVADRTTGCSPACINFNSVSGISSGTIYSWLWMFDNESVPNGVNCNFCFEEKGDYAAGLICVSDKGCRDTAKKDNYITILPRPKASFQVKPEEVSVLSPVVNIINSSENTNNVHWAIGDESFDNEPENFIYTFNDTGTYYITQIVMNESGCMDSVKQTVRVNPLFTLYVPSAFTPNEDGLNDKFMPGGDGIKTFEMRIFDRWGNLITTIHDFSKDSGWNGKTDGGLFCSQDEYHYKITITIFNGTQQSFIGVILLLR